MRLERISFHCEHQLTVSQVFLNIVLDDAVEEKDGGEKVKLGMVVSIGEPEGYYQYELTAI